jgi:hypothetical protein
VGALAGYLGNTHKSTGRKGYQYDGSNYNQNSRTNYDYASQVSLRVENLNIAASGIKVYPDPSTDFIQIAGLTSTVDYDVFNVLGSKLISGTLAIDEKIDIKKLTSGTYLLRINKGTTVKFVK